MTARTVTVGDGQATLTTSPAGWWATHPDRTVTGPYRTRREARAAAVARHQRLTDHNRKRSAA